jgi:hypothetical protein
MTAYFRTSDSRIVDLAPETVAGLAPSKRDTLRLYSVDPMPTPPPSQFVVDGPLVVDQTTARKTWELRDKTPAQLEAEAFAANQQATLEQARAIYHALKNGTGTAAERLTRVERVAAHYLRGQFGGEPT